MTSHQFAVVLFWRAFALRALFGIVIASLELPMLHGDDRYYESAGWQVAEVWTGREPAFLLSDLSRTLHAGMQYWLGMVYYLFGDRWLLVPLLVNWAVGAAAAVLIYRIGVEIFNDRVGRLAGSVVAYAPSFAFWSSLLYKEASVLFLIALAIHSTLQLQKRISLWHALLAVAALLGIQLFRSYLTYLLAGSMALGMLAGSTRVRPQPGQRAAVVLFLLLILAGGGLQRARSQFAIHPLQSILYRIELGRADLAATAGSGYFTDVRITTMGEAVRYLPKGLAYLLLAPAPWQLGTVRQTMAIPETLIWYWLIPATLAGMVFAWRHRRAECVTVLVFTFALTLFYAMFIGNIGTAVRERLQMFAFWSIFAAAGLELRHARPRVADTAPS